MIEKYLGWKFVITEDETTTEGEYPCHRSQWTYNPSVFDRLFSKCPRKPTETDISFHVEAQTSLGCVNRGFEVIEYRNAKEDLLGEHEPPSIKALHS